MTIHVFILLRCPFVKNTYIPNNVLEKYSRYPVRIPHETEILWRTQIDTDKSKLQAERWCNEEQWVGLKVCLLSLVINHSTDLESAPLMTDLPCSPVSSAPLCSGARRSTTECTLAPDHISARRTESGLDNMNLDYFIIISINLVLMNIYFWVSCVRLYICIWLLLLHSSIIMRIGSLYSIIKPDV